MTTPNQTELEKLIQEARELIEYTAHSDSADHLKVDYRVAWAFVRKVAGINIKESKSEAQIKAEIRKIKVYAESIKADLEWAAKFHMAQAEASAKKIIELSESLTKSLKRG